jgi:hypothetical protein
MDGDGLMDLITPTQVFRNTSSGQNITFATPFSQATTQVADYQIAVADINKDGKLDIQNNITKYDEDNSRFIGSLNTLMEDLPYSSTNEKDLRNSQLMHDILLFIVLSEYLIH